MTVRCSKGLRVVEYMGSFAQNDGTLVHVAAWDSDKCVVANLVRTRLTHTTMRWATPRCGGRHHDAVGGVDVPFGLASTEE